MDNPDFPSCGYVPLPEPKPNLRLARQGGVPDPAMVFTECRRLARKEVKEGLRRQGRRPIEMDVAELQRLAQAYFEEHRSELIELARKRLSER